MIDNIWLVQTIVRPSGVHGLGRFSLADLDPHTPVGIFSGDVVPKTGEHLPIRGTSYCIRCPQTFINHSSDANLVLDGQILVRTSRSVKAGEELFLDYRQLTSSPIDFI